MTIRTKQSIRAIYLRHAEQNALADTIDLLELTAAEAGLPVEVVEAVVNEEGGGGVSSYDDAIETGFKSLEKLRDHPQMQEQIRNVMAMLYRSEMMFALRFGNFPKPPFTDPRWYGVQARAAIAQAGSESNG